jgi:anaerobic magnesium-protoporphyrin IX monomethyl ester cyclase
MKTDILLISLQKDIDVIGLKYLHYTLLQNDYKSVLLFLPNLQAKDDYSLEYISSFIHQISPSVIGLSFMSHEYFEACYLTSLIKKIFPQTPVIWGGIHPTIAPEECLQYADYVCIGEGEQTILDIANKVMSGSTDFRLINNLCYKESDQIKRNPLYPLIDDLNTLPICEHRPQYSYIEYGRKIVPLTQKMFRKYARYHGITLSIMSSRGCPFACTYCCNNIFHRLYNSNKVRHRSVANVISEIEKAIHDNPYIQHINFADDCFLSSSEEYLQEFCVLYKKKVRKPFIIRTIPIFINREKMQILKNAGIGWIALGLQSGSDRICRDVYNRKSFKSDFLKAAQIIKDLNISALYDIILDNPFETEEDQLETIRTLIETPKPFLPQLLSLTFYLGTDLFERVSRDKSIMIENSREKNFFLYKKNVLNDITRIVIFLDKKKAYHIVDQYLRDPNSLYFKLSLAFAKFKTALILEPLSYLKLIHLSHGEGYLKTLSLLPYYFKDSISRYLIQF